MLKARIPPPTPRNIDRTSARQITKVPTPRVGAVDTNGAGDAHAGVLGAALLEGIPRDRALVLANCAGALSTTRPGPATCPDRLAIEDAADKLVGSAD